MEYLTVEEAAERLHVSVATMRRRCSSGDVEAMKVGAQWLVHPDALQGAGARRKRRATPANPKYDLQKAWTYVQATDLSEVWIPDVVRFRDYIDNAKHVLDEADSRLQTLKFGPAQRLDVPKTAASNRPGVLLELPDRVAYQAVIGTFSHLIDEALAPTVYSSRLANDGRHFLQHGPTRWKRFESGVQKQADEDGFNWVAHADISAYFEHVQHSILFEELSGLGVSGDPLHALRKMLSRWALVPGIGLPQGPNASRVLGNFYLAQVDEAILARGYSYHRYMDDVRILTKTKAGAHAAIRKFEHLCRARGLICSSAKTSVLSLPEYKEKNDSSEMNLASYFFERGDLSKARSALKNILHAALKVTEIRHREARFSIWRLARIRERTTLGRILSRLEDLAPVASAVSAYMKYFVARPAIQARLAEFMQDRERSYSAFLRTWVYAAMIEAKKISDSWVEISYADAVDKNQPNYLRAVALCALAKARRPRDVRWMKSELDNEHDPVIRRALLVALRYGDALDKQVIQNAASRAADSLDTGNWLRQRSRLPSLLYADQTVDVG